MAKADADAAVAVQGDNATVPALIDQVSAVIKALPDGQPPLEDALATGMKPLVDGGLLGAGADDVASRTNAGVCLAFDAARFIAGRTNFVAGRWLSWYSRASANQEGETGATIVE
jgi:hypothetical protein